MGYRTWNDIEDDQQNQRRLHQLRLVCKQFNEVFAAQSLFLKRLSLPKAFPISSLPSLLGWLQQSKDCLEVLEANCPSPTVDVVSGALTSIRSQLKLVSVWDASTACSMQLLGSFSSLETCTLSSLRGSLNLTPLQALPKLRSLWLAGDFDGLASLSHLTHIQCLAGFLDCTGSCKFGRTLQQLDVERTIFENFDISVCQGLRVLKLDLSRVIHHHSLMYTSGPPITPVGLSLLTKLETLSLTSSLTSCDYISLAWINELTTLQHLSIKFSYVESRLIKSLPLSRLTRLVVSGSDDQDFRDSPCLVLDLDFDWSSLKALKHLFLSCCKLEVGPGSASLLLLQHLTDITLRYVMPETVASLEHYVALIHSLVTLRPHVRLDFQSTAIHHFLDYGKHIAPTGQQ